jgi:hypothetical protein
VTPNRRDRLIALLSTPNAIAGTVAVSIVALVIAVYVVIAQINLTGCLAAYNEHAAISQRVRAEAAAEDRELEVTERRLNASDRAQDRADDAAFDLVLTTIGATDDRARRARAFANLVKVRTATAATRQANDAARADLDRRRQLIDERRQANPPPEPPSRMCD